MYDGYSGGGMMIKELEDLKRDVLRLKEELKRLKEELRSTRIQELRETASLNPSLNPLKISFTRHTPCEHVSQT